VRALERGAVRGILARRLLRRLDPGVAAVAVGAAEDDGRVLVHRVPVGGRVAAHAAGALGVRLGRRLPLRGRRARGVRAGHRRLGARIGPHGEG